MENASRRGSLTPSSSDSEEFHSTQEESYEASTIGTHHIQVNEAGIPLAGASHSASLHGSPLSRARTLSACEDNEEHDCPDSDNEVEPGYGDQEVALELKTDDTSVGAIGHGDSDDCLMDNLRVMFSADKEYMLQHESGLVVMGPTQEDRMTILSMLTELQAQDMLLFQELQAQMVQGYVIVLVKHLPRYCLSEGEHQLGDMKVYVGPLKLSKSEQLKAVALLMKAPSREEEPVAESSDDMRALQEELTTSSGLTRKKRRHRHLSSPTVSELEKAIKHRRSSSSSLSSEDTLLGLSRSQEPVVTDSD